MARASLPYGYLYPKKYQMYLTELTSRYYAQFGPATVIIESFNRFMDKSLKEILLQNGYLEYEENIAQSMDKRLHTVRTLSITIEKEVTRQEADGTTHLLYPNEARNRNLTYAKKVIAKFQHEIFNVDSAGHRVICYTGSAKVCIGLIPIMILSNHCNLSKLTPEQIIEQGEDDGDLGGYFIINGKEKVLISQERPAMNKFFIFNPMSDASYQLEAEIRSSANSTGEVSALWIRIPGAPTRPSARENRSDDLKFHKPSRTVSHKLKHSGEEGYFRSHEKSLYKEYKKDNPGFIVYHTALREPFPLMVLYKALGFMDDRSVFESLGITQQQQAIFAEVLRMSMFDSKACSIKTQEEALSFIGQLRKVKESEKWEDRDTGKRRVFTADDHIDRGASFVNDEVLPHVGNVADKHNWSKGVHIGYMINRLVKTHLGEIPVDDRDHLENKRFDVAGPLMDNMLKRVLNVMLENWRLQVKRKVENVQGRKRMEYDFFRDIAGRSTMTKGVLYSFSTGNWGDKRNCSTVRVAVAQPLNRMSRLATIGFLRRINSPFNKLVRMTIPRKVHSTGFGYICPCDTPEGEPVGLLKSLSTMAQISVESDTEPVMRSINTVEFNPLSRRNLHRFSTETKIFVNAKLVGTCTARNAGFIVERLKQYRSSWKETEYTASSERLRIEKDSRRKEEEKRGLPPGTLGDADVDDDINPMISNHISILHDLQQREIRIRTDSGRAIRPLLVVSKQALKLKENHIQQLKNSNNLHPYSWDDLVKDGLVEYVDAAEEENCLIAMYPCNLEDAETHTHCELDPSVILGPAAAEIPYVNHDQMPRVSFQTNMAKQAIGLSTFNFRNRYDIESHVLDYPQKPLVTTRAAAFTKSDEYPSGANAIVAICTYGGYNQEDSVILNRSAIERGLFRSTLYATKCDEAKRNKGMGDMDETFERPSIPGIRSIKATKYAKLDDDGFPAIGSTLADGDPIIGKTRSVSKIVKQQQEASGHPVKEQEDVSQLQKVSSASKPGVVDSIMLSSNADGYPSAKVRVRSVREPQIGDKFASRHGQKGVMGMHFYESDMPFTKDGMVPDIILNPHAIPSRMTIGHLIEMLASKTSACDGIRRDGTAFDLCALGKSGDELSTELGTQLQKLGFNQVGLEVLYNGHTGRKIQAQCFVGPCMYQRLKHMVEDKLHCRARGPVTTLCRQPNAGITSNGGLRFGEMERDCTISHGAMQFLKERMLQVSDQYYVPICQRCGQIMIKFTDPRPPAEGQKRAFMYKCQVCKFDCNKGVDTIEIPYAFKLLMQELGSMNINVILQAEDDEIVQQGPRGRREVPGKEENSESNNSAGCLNYIFSTMESHPRKQPREDQ